MVIRENNNNKVAKIDYDMTHYINNHPVKYNYGSYAELEILDNKGNGKYTVSCNGYSVDLEFDLNDNSAKYVFTIDNTDKYKTNSYEQLILDVATYIDWAANSFDDDLDEELLDEFCSNFEGTEFGEVEFYSEDLSNYPEYRIKNAIETGCSFPINIYTIDYERSGNLVISYEVKEEDYNPDNIEQEIIAVLERLENRIRG